jgi:hypothetical protein
MVHYYRQVNSISNIPGYHSGGLRSDIHSLHVLINVNEWLNCGNRFVVISMEPFCVLLLIKRMTYDHIQCLISNLSSVD